ncbi:MAG TPA: DUF1800 domain-containing protein [Thermoanaerobaculia bacterium]|nr:DUF1800 domain-containing protein [Thermoanaerobaculia bacterium]
MQRAVALTLAFLLALPVTAGPSAAERERAAHVLNRLAFGARPGEVDRVARMDVDRWIAEQLQPEKISDAAVDQRLARYETLTWSTSRIMKEVYQPLVTARRKAQKDGEDSGEGSMRELRREAQRVVGDLSAQRIVRAAESERQLNEIMVDFWMNHFNVFAGKSIDRFLLTSYERDTIRPHIWGSFEELLLASAKSPAMLFYLDNARSRRGGINENYAREIMELHSLGVDGGYTQKDVSELARVLTGWSIERKSGNFMFRPALHDRDAKTVLGIKLPAGGGIEEGERMIRHLATHPSTARHIARKLAERLVTDDPPAALVDRVAARFTATRGNLRETVKAVITSPEFNDPKYYRVKVKSPFEYTISAVRAIGGRIENPIPLALQLKKMGQPLYFAQPPTGYGDDAASWVNSGALVERINFAIALTGGTMRGIRVPDISDPLNLAGVALSADTLKVIADRKTDDPAAIAGLVIGSPEFQRQ